MGKVMDNVGFSTKKQDLQNTAKRELTEDEKMAIRQDLGLYGEYPQVMMSGEFTGFTQTSQGYQARYTDLSEFPAEVQEFFNDTLPQQLLTAANKGEDLPIYEVDCDGEKRVYPIFYKSQRGQMAVYFGVNGGDMDYSIDGDKSGAFGCAIYNIAGSGLTFSRLQIKTSMPGTAHKITLTDVTPGRVNQIPDKYLPSALVVELLDLTPPSDDHNYYTAEISDEDLAKINANPAANVLLKYMGNGGMNAVYFSPLLVQVSENRGVVQIITIMGLGSDDNPTITPLIIDTIRA